jgi:RES domain-containing protein
LDQAIYASTWDSGEGAYLVGGRWNSRGVRAVYCSIDPGTAILEVAVHKGFKALDMIPHVITEVTIDPPSVFVVEPSMIPNPNWLRPGIPSAGQQAFGDDLLSDHKFLLIPSVVSTASWN